MKIPSPLPFFAALLLVAASVPALAQRAAACYFESAAQDLGTGSEVRCSYSFRHNANGHVVVDVLWFDGVRSSYVFWDSGVAEIFSGDRRYLGQWLSRNGVTLVFHQSNAVTGLPFTVYAR